MLHRVETCNGFRGNKSSFYLYINSKRLSKENEHLLMNGVGNLVIADTDKAEVLTAAFVLVFINKVFQDSVHRDRVQGELYQ